MRTLTGHSWLDYSATLSRVTSYTTTTDGSQIPSATSVTTVACCVQPHNSREMLEWMRITGERVSLGIFDPLTSTGVATSIQKDDVLSITDPGGTARSYRAMGQGRNSSGVGVLIECDLKEIQ